MRDGSIIRLHAGGCIGKGWRGVGIKRDGFLSHGWEFYAGRRLDCRDRAIARPGGRPRKGSRGQPGAPEGESGGYAAARQFNS